MTSLYFLYQNDLRRYKLVGFVQCTVEALYTLTRLNDYAMQIRTMRVAVYCLATDLV